MPWTALRLTTNLTDDGAWHGLLRSSTSAPASGRASDNGASIFVPVGGAGQGSAVVFDSTKIAVCAAWCASDGTPLAGEGTALTLEPVWLVTLPHPVHEGQRSERLLVGAPVDATAAVGTWAPVYLEAGPVALASVRVSGADATGVTGAARVGIWVWTR